MALGDVWKTITYCGLGNQLAMNTRYYRINFESEVSNFEPAAVAAFFSGVWHQAYKALLAQQAEFLGVFAQKWRPEPVEGGAVTGANRGVGTVVGTPLPSQVSGLISFRASLSGHRFRGRNYVPFPSTGSITGGGNPAASYTTALRTLGDLMLSPPTWQLAGGAVEWDLMLFGPSKDATEPGGPLPEQLTEIVEHTPRGLWATQRSRGAYGQSNLPFPVSANEPPAELSIDPQTGLPRRGRSAIPPNGGVA